MSAPRERPPAVAMAEEFLGSPRFVSALTTASIGVGVLSFALRRTIGWPGLIAALVVLVVLAAGSAYARRSAIEWRGLLPISLIVFLGWACLSLLWSHYRWASVGGLAYLGGFTALALYIALMRGTIQVVRSFGDVLRFVLALSLAIEIISGALIDSPITFLDVLGRLPEGGPIQGVEGARNALGILAVMALVTFGIEYRTKSVDRPLAYGSAILAGVVLLLTRSPLAYGALVIAVVAAAALYGLRRVRPERRRIWQFALLGTVAVVAVAAWAARAPIVQLFSATGDLTYRLDVWYRVWPLISLNPLEGWGWIGTWRDDIDPFVLFRGLSDRTESSASNAYLDVWFQLGLVGLAIFVGMVALALTRSWLLASRQRSVVFAWPALILVVLVTTALAESSMLVEFGWLTFVVCLVKAAEQLSWRNALAVNEPAEES